MIGCWKCSLWHGGGPQERARHLGLLRAGLPVAWETTKQPFVAQSTAEAELMGYCESLLEVILGEQLTQKRIYGDNVAAIALACNGSGSWRTRHLRIRAAPVPTLDFQRHPHKIQRHPPWFPCRWKLKGEPLKMVVSIVGFQGEIVVSMLGFPRKPKTRSTTAALQW